MRQNFPRGIESGRWMPRWLIERKPCFDVLLKLSCVFRPSVTPQSADREKHGAKPPETVARLA